MYPEIFELYLNFEFHSLGTYKITVYSYFTFIIIGCLFAYKLSKKYQLYFFKKIIFKSEFILLIVISSLIGGKLLLIFNDIQLFKENVYNSNYYTKGGFVFFGSLILSSITSIFYLKNKKIQLPRAFDIIVIITSLIQGFGRLGCFFAGCCFGKDTTIFSQTIFDDIFKSHPTQLYESFFSFALCISLCLNIKKTNPGITLLNYLIYYCVFRYFIEFLRDDSRGYLFNNLLSHSQFISLLILLISFISVYYNLKTKTKYYEKFKH